MQERFRILRLSFLVLFGAVFLRLGFWQLVMGPDLRAQALAQYERTTTMTSSRGKMLFADGYPLVMNAESYSLFATPKTLSVSADIARQLLFPHIFSPDTLIATDPAKLALAKDAFSSSLLSKLLQQEKQWVLLKTGLSKEQKNAISSLGIKGLGFDAFPRRFYPEASMAAHLTGFVGKDVAGQDKGYFGIEGEYDMELRGAQVTSTRETDAFGHPIAIVDEKTSVPLSSRDLTLTVRRDIQFLLEEKLKESLVRYGARAADAIIMEPKTGKILAMAAVPYYDQATFSTYDPTLYKNPTIADGYEPGSTFKVLTVAAGIDAGVITPSDTCDACAGPVTIGKYMIKTWNEEYHPNITITDALSKSDNTAMVFVARRLGKERFLSAIKQFGVGEKTGIDLQEEASPPLRPDASWGDIDLATSSFGQGVAVTGMQMLSAVSAIANDGVLMRPYVVSRVSSATQTYDVLPQERRRVISSTTAKTVAQMMIDSASHGDAKWTLPKQYSIAGKTGTAQIPVDGHYDAERTIASFVGFAPAHDAKFAMLVRVIEPTSSPWGSETAAPLWFSIAKELFLKFGIQPNQ